VDGSDADKLLAHRKATARPLAEFCDVPIELSELVGRMLAKSPADRPQACGAVAAALGPFCTDVVAPPSDDELPRLSPAARGSAEPGRIPVAVRPGGASGRSDPGSSGSLSQFNLPQSGSGSRSSCSYRSKSAVGRGDTRAPDDTARTSRRASADPDQNPPLRWLALVAAASALGACLGIMLWSRLAG
jgi:hypothetical protein